MIRGGNVTAYFRRPLSLRRFISAARSSGVMSAHRLDASDAIASERSALPMPLHRLRPSAAAAGFLRGMDGGGLAVPIHARKVRAVVAVVNRLGRAVLESDRVSLHVEGLGVWVALLASVADGGFHGLDSCTRPLVCQVAK